MGVRSLMNSGRAKIPRIGMKTRMQPAAMPGRVRGTVTLQNVLAGEAPRSCEASRSRFGSFSIDEYRGRIMNGRKLWTRAKTTALSQFDQPRGSRQNLSA